MTLVQLRHLLALAQTGSFSKAAQAQFLTQPALSRSIRALEDELGLPLFDRIGRRIEPTPFGRETLARAQRLLAAADELKGSGRPLREGHVGVLRLGMGSGPGALLMTPLLMRTAQQRPQLRVEVARGGTDLLVQALRERRLDALVVDALSLRPAPDLRMLAVRAAAPGLVALSLSPALDAHARFGLVTLTGRTAPPALAAVRALMAELMTERTTEPKPTPTPKPRGLRL